MSRILFLTPQLPYPPHQGAAIRNLNLIKLAAQKHEVEICSFVRSPEEAAQAGVLREWATRVRTIPAPRRTMAERAVRTAFSPTPDMGRRLSSPSFAAQAADGDIVQAEGIEMAQYLETRQGKKVLDCHNAEWLLQRRASEVDLREGKLIGAVYSAIQSLKLRRYERQACGRANAVVAVSEEDRQALRALHAGRTVDVIPNGVDAAFFSPAMADPDPGNILFTGTLDFRPNIDAVLWLARQVWPLVRACLPNAALTIAGRAPVAAISRLHGQNGICVAANPPDIRPYFQAAALYVVPVRSGGGSRYKLLQALSTSLAIVSTTVGAEGLAVRDGEHLRLADSPREIAASLVELAADRAQRRRLGEAGRDLVLRQYDWPVLGPLLWRLYDRLLNQQ